LQIWLAKTVASKDQCSGVRVPVAGQYPAHHAVRVDEARPIALERELRGARPLLLVQDRLQTGRCAIVVEQAGSSQFDIADRQARTNIHAGLRHMRDLAPST